MKTWRRQDLETNLSFEVLLDIRARQLGAIEERIQEASNQVEESRMDDKARWDQLARIRKVPLKVGDVVLLYDSSLEKQWSRKLHKRWLGPYRIVRCGDFGAYQIEELDETEWKDWVPGTRLKKSDFTKTAIPRGGRGTRPPRRPLGASRGYGRHGSHRREHTPVYDDGDIKLFLNEFWRYAEHMGWTMAERIERLRGVGRFEEPIARIRRETRTWPEVEMRMQELRPSPVGPDGVPIHLEIGNVEEFIPAFEHFMHEQNVLRDEGARGRGALRPERQSHLEEDERPLREESVPKTGEQGAYPECRLGPMIFHRFTREGLRGSPQRVLEEMPPSGGPLQELEAHLDISRWRVPQTEERCDEPVGGVPREEVPEPGREVERGAQGGRVMEEVIEVGEDTPPRTPAPETGPEIVSDVAQEAGRELQRGEIPLPPPDTTLSPGVRIEMERERNGWRREALSTIDRYLAAHAQEHLDIKRPMPMEPPREPHQAEKEALAEIPEREDHRTRGRAPTRETTEERRARVGKRVEEIKEERQRLEAAGALPDQPPDAPPKPCGVKEMWDEFWGSYGEGLAVPERAGFGTSRSATEYLDCKIRFLAKTSFNRYLMLEDDLADKKIKEVSHGVRLEAVEAEVRELRALTASQAATIQEMRQHLQDTTTRRDQEPPTRGVDWTESRRGDIQGEATQGLSRQPSLA
ncbi:hypothetical protein CBR_g32109 [Chara braunii]|uniref:Uncharacterized protein n=1 Tax=Chara braunii TaxID=69332 RepID=A0A388LGV6_CHABU|nr:hypothetical protein CBR_g32109 [Chara braunii]|eukprot:GBG81432.1 hypothetical protein CBR_g32109 [Chara braunii]